MSHNSTETIHSRNLSEMHKGWFVGDFSPSLYPTQDVEVAVKHYQAGDAEKKHYHKISTEFTVIVSGKVRMNDSVYSAGDIVIVPPNQATDFEALEDTITSVVKIPGAPDDKYFS